MRFSFKILLVSCFIYGYDLNHMLCSIYDIKFNTAKSQPTISNPNPVNILSSKRCLFVRLQIIQFIDKHLVKKTKLPG